MQHYSKLEVWRRSHQLVLALYHCTDAFPATERYGLSTQLRRAASSVPTNIAEGSKRVSPNDYAHFLNIAEGSLSETEYLLLLSRDLGYIAQDAARNYLTEISELLRMLHALRKTVQRDAAPNPAQKKPARA
jgi:four helix bundle protein